MTRKSLNKEDTKTAISALVTPYLDYGNALLYGINQRLLNKLQVAQNSLAWLVERLNKYDHITPIRKELHWLPIKSRIEFKLNMTWKALNNKSPLYITGLRKELPLRACNLRSITKKFTFESTPRRHQEQ